jgi:hypothetical protein
METRARGGIRKLWNFSTASSCVSALLDSSWTTADVPHYPWVDWPRRLLLVPTILVLWWFGQEGGAEDFFTLALFGRTDSIVD